MIISLAKREALQLWEALQLLLTKKIQTATFFKLFLCSRMEFTKRSNR